MGKSSNSTQGQHEGTAGTERQQALLLGLAIGDALGVPVEFKARGTFHVTKMEGYGTHNQPPGTWSDDTSLALALADALRFDDVNVEGMARRFIEWRDHAAYTPRGKVFDVGNATNRAIERLKRGVEPTEAGGAEEWDNGNGSLMRVAPLVFFMSGKEARARYDAAKAVSSITHAHPCSVTACFIYLEMLNLLKKGRDKKTAYIELRRDIPAYGFLDRDTLARFERVLKGDIATLKEDEIRSSGFVVDTLEASFWSFLTTGNYADAVLRAVNLGEDTDTTGAVTGAMAGLYYGLEISRGNGWTRS